MGELAELIRYLERSVLPTKADILRVKELALCLSLEISDTKEAEDFLARFLAAYLDFHMGLIANNTTMTAESRATCHRCLNIMR